MIRQKYSEKTSTRVIRFRSENTAAPTLSAEAKSVLALSKNLLRVPANVYSEIFNVAEYMRHTNQPHAAEAITETLSNPFDGVSFAPGTYFCANCQRHRTLDVHGRCEVCGSDAVVEGEN